MTATGATDDRAADPRMRRRRRILRIGVAVAVVVVLAFAGLASLTYVAFLRPPSHSPEDFLATGPAPGTEHVVVAAGASITQGSLGADWVGMLRDRWSSQGYEFVNAGRNGDTGAGLLHRLETDVLACRPDAVSLLIGTNGVTAGAPVDGYRATMDTIVARIVASGAQVAIVSLPPVGEDLSSELNARVRAYNQALAAVAAQHGAAYLPLHERLVELIDRHRPDGGAPYDFSFPLALRTAFEHYVLGRDWDMIAEGNGLVALTDHTHLSQRSGAILTDLVSGWLTATL